MEYNSWDVLRTLLVHSEKGREILTRLEAEHKKMLTLEEAELALKTSGTMGDMVVGWTMDALRQHLAQREIKRGAAK